jgi:hypothetical protein
MDMFRRGAKDDRGKGNNITFNSFMNTEDLDTKNLEALFWSEIIKDRVDRQPSGDGDRPMIITLGINSITVTKDEGREEVKEDLKLKIERRPVKREYQKPPEDE